jgi:diaminopimelate epimerase
MRVPFIKMHGLGNDFVVLDARAQAADARQRVMPAVDADLVRELADRQTGIGCDQLILLEPSACADLRMRIFNQDGSEVEACGNATRAVGLLHGGPASIETLSGIIATSPDAAGVAVNIGAPRFDWNAIPLAYAMDTLNMPVGWGELSAPAAVNVGNPHVVFFVPDCDAVALAELGPVVEHDALFPERINVNVATVTARDAIRLRVWERGAGLTRACGTGACAAAAVAMRRGLVGRDISVTLPGGTLRIAWPADGEIVMTGPAQESFRGSFDPADYGCAPA